MTAEQVAELGPQLTGHLEGYRECFGRRPTFEHFETYCRGLLSGEGRKSVEPIALAAGAGVRAMQLFLTGLRWDEGRMRDLAQKRVAAFTAPAGAELRKLRKLKPGEVGRVGLFDETG